MLAEWLEACVTCPLRQRAASAARVVPLACRPAWARAGDAAGECGGVGVGGVPHDSLMIIASAMNASSTL